MAIDIRSAISRWLDAYAEPPPTRPALKDAALQWERLIKERDERLVRGLLDLAEADTTQLECEYSFERALAAAEKPQPDVDYIASRLWLALGEPAVSSKAAESRTRVKKEWRGDIDEYQGENADQEDELVAVGFKLPG